MHQNPFSAGADPAWGAYDAPPDPLVGWGGGYPLPIPLPARHLRRLELGAYTAPRFSGPPQHKILATPVFKGEYLANGASDPLHVWF